MAEILVLGGGFGGLAGAHRLREELPPEHDVTLVARDDRFYMGFAKLWDLGRVRDLDAGTRSLHGLERGGIRYVQAEIDAIDPASHRVETSEGPLEADALLVALGVAPSPERVSWLRGPAYDLYDGRSLPAMHEALDRLDHGRVVISILGAPFRCPPAPYEAALLVDERLRERGVRDDVEVVIATPQPMTVPAAGPDASRFVAERLGERGIELLAEHAVEHIDADRQHIDFSGSELDYDLLLAVPGDVPTPVVAGSPLAGPGGWIHADPSTLSTGFEHVYAVGDCTHIPTATGALPKAGVFAAGEAQVAARNIVADLFDGPRASFDGHGFCYLEFPGREVAIVEGDFYAQPAPDVTISDPSRDNFARKLDYEQERLARWLG
jgi:sulfide:quinone oxidoreductase